MKKLLEYTSVLPELASRITIGWVFAESGWGKIQNLGQVTEFFKSLNIPMAEIQAPMVSGIELVAGVLILLGLFSRLAALPLIGIMVVAIFTAKLEEISDFSTLLGNMEFLYIVILLWLATHKSRFFALNLVFDRFCKKGTCKA